MGFKWDTLWNAPSTAASVEQEFNQCHSCYCHCSGTLLRLNFYFCKIRLGLDNPQTLQPGMGEVFSVLSMSKVRQGVLEWLFSQNKNIESLGENGWALFWSDRSIWALPCLTPHLKVRDTNLNKFHLRWNSEYSKHFLIISFHFTIIYFLKLFTSILFEWWKWCATIHFPNASFRDVRLVAWNQPR